MYTTVSSVESSSIINSHQAARLLDIFSAPTEANQAFLTSASALVDYLDNLSSHTEGVTENFGAFELTGLKALGEQYGVGSESYQTALSLLRSILESALARPGLHVALVTYPSSSSNIPFYKRQEDQPQSPLPIPHPAEPIGSVSTCFQTAEVCGNQTDSCSGHGECVSATKAGRTCFVCACAASTNDQGLKEEWAGEACERKDVSGCVPCLTLVINEDLHSTLSLQAFCSVDRYDDRSHPSRCGIGCALVCSRFDATTEYVNRRCSGIKERVKGVKLAQVLYDEPTWTILVIRLPFQSVLSMISCTKFASPKQDG